MTAINLPVNELKPALAGLSKLISKRATLPILRAVAIIRETEGWVTLTGTDLDSFATVRLEQPEQGECVGVIVPLQELAKLAKDCCASDTISIVSISNNRAVVEYPIGNQTGSVHIESFPFDEFPQIPTRIEGTPLNVEDGMRTGILEALQCASTDETRYVINGAYIDVSDKSGHYVVGTDGKHLYSSNSFKLALDAPIIIPDEKFIAWKGFSDDGAWQIAVDKENAKIELSSRRWKFITNAVDGNYPNWRQVTPDPKAATTTLKLSQEVREVILKLVPKLPCHDELYRTIGLVVDDKKVSIRGRGKDDDDWTEVEIAGAIVTGRSLTIYLNRDFLTKALKFGLGEIAIIDSLSPIRFVDAGRQMVVMPIRATEPMATSTEEAAQEPNGNATSEAEQEERKTMPRTPAASTQQTTNGNTPNHEQPTGKSALELAADQVEVVKSAIRSARDGLNGLLETLKQIQRDHRSNEREVQTARATLDKLRSVRI